MKSFENGEYGRPHHEIRQYATESQALISWGEEFLDRAHKLAHSIEEHVQPNVECTRESFQPELVRSTARFEPLILLCSPLS